MDVNIQDLNIELLEEICTKKKDYQFVFDNLSTLVKSLKALNQLLMHFETAEDCIYNLPQIEEILSNLIINKIVLLNQEAVTCIIHCIFEFSKFFKDKSKSDFILSNVKLSNTQLWCIQRIRTLMISTEFPRTKYIKQLEESIKTLNYSSTDFYEEIINEQLSILKSFVEFNKNENSNIDIINDILDVCVYMLDQTSIILPLVEEIIKAR
ncbi:hypothetical protein BCR36DRAFT_366331 [Piromyces finnis]|uniref:Uncharacterized protein n=1 Tax=Piromyces finnis TaxID=1754191 RepID=A0A1Y1VLX2_9FUNG|nr:hypothetical protein BCR36DRAFT_366331 [Piromyces finnis]|eukprot:ORX59145.1 hypothetical protein BCR36DRAFT_366331 [Piromyces finnis]